MPSAKCRLLLTCAVADGAAAKVSGGAEALVVARVGAARARGSGVAARGPRPRLRVRHQRRARAQVPAGGRGLIQVLSGGEVCEYMYGWRVGS